MKFKRSLISQRKIFLTSCVVLLSFQYSDVLAATQKIQSRSKSSAKPVSSGNSGVGTLSTNNSIPIPGLGEGIPNYILGEIRSLDQHLKCFPKLLCTIYQDNSILEKMGSLNATELGVAYIKLLKAVHYGSRTTTSTTTVPPTKVKAPIIQIFQIPAGLITASTYSGRKDHHFHHLDDLEDYPDHLRSPSEDEDDVHDDDDIHNDYTYDPENNPRRDLLNANDVSDEDREFLKERLEITQMMQDSKEEDNALANKEFSSSEGSGSSIATTLLSSFLPFLGSRSIKERSVVDWKKMEELLRTEEQKKEQADRMRQGPFWRAVNRWRKLQKRSECNQMYESCPFEAWEIVRMLDLVKDQSKVLSAYLRITVDNVKPARFRY